MSEEAYAMVVLLVVRNNFVQPRLNLVGWAILKATRPISRVGGYF